MKVPNWIESEMLLALWHLRYLTSEQIQRHWHRDRTSSASLKRLSRLGQDGILERVLLHDKRWRSAWRLGPEGVRHLRESKQSEFSPAPPVSEKFVPHVLETNEVFLLLVGAEVVWDRLPFKWRGSHRVKLGYRRWQVGDEPERGIIRPDAMIVPRDVAGTRVFVELDRSTECLSPKDGRRSITRKLEAYHRFLLAKHAPDSPYQRTFGDTRPARVLFVLSKRDARARDPKLRDRRLRAIGELAHKAFKTFDRPPVTCVYLDDTQAIAKACGVQVAAVRAEPKPEPKVEVTRDQLHSINTLFAYYVNLWRRLGPESRTRVPAKAAGQAARQILLGLSPPGTSLPELDALLRGQP